jgi:hypothetical protein
MKLDRRDFLKETVAAAGLGGLSLTESAAPDASAQPKDANTKDQVTIQRTIPIRHEVDIFVAGGGPSGIAAAVGAARQGRSVFLAERQNCLGGMGTAGLLPVFMPFTDGVNFLAGGIGREIKERLTKCGGNGPGSDVTIRAEVLKRVYDDLLAESSAGFCFYTQLIGVEVEGGRATLAILAGKSGLFAVRAKQFVDSTGDGDLAVLAGAPYEKGDAAGNMMAGTLCSLWAGIDWQVAAKEGLPFQDKRLEAAFKDKMFTIEDRHLPGMTRTGENLGGGNIGHTFGVDGTDERSLTKAMIWARKSLLEYERYYKKYLRGFEDMELAATGAMLGIRETRRIMGDYVLNLEDFKKRAAFEDEIGRFSYPVDLHASSASAADYQKFLEEFKSLRYGKGENYGIPYRCLIPRKLSNVLVAGRCVSTDRYMQSSIRVMPGCFITGQAAGIAAALAVEKGTDTRGVNVKELQQRLKKIGAYLPNC